MGRPIDTSVDADERQREAFRAMTSRDRLQLAATMSAEVRTLAESGIRQRHPEYSADQREAAMAEILLGPELAALVQRSRHPLRQVGTR